MKVLLNEAVQNPTKMEATARKQAEERLEKHIRENETRKLTKEQKHAKIKRKQEQDIQQGVNAAVFRYNFLALLLTLVELMI